MMEGFREVRPCAPCERREPSETERQESWVWGREVSGKALDAIV